MHLEENNNANQRKNPLKFAENTDTLLFVASLRYFKSPKYSGYYLNIGINH